MSSFMNKVILGDCLEIIYKLPPKCVDLILTDPPYNIASNSKLTKVGDKITTTEEAWGGFFQDKFDEGCYLGFMESLAKCYDYVLKENGSIITFFDRSKPYYLQPFYDKFHFRNMICFIKTNPVPHFRKNNYRSTFEQCAWFSREKYKINFIDQSSMKNVFYGSIGRKETVHPTEKYKWMIEPLIERHSNEGDLILDPMCGSGTTGVIAKSMNRNFIMIDNDEKSIEISLKRING